jgi:hypothetical protein
MIRLDTTNRTLQLYLGGAHTTAPLQTVVSYSDQTSTTYLGGTQLTNSNGTTAVTICSAPSASTVRDIDMVSVLNTDTASQVVTIKLVDTSTAYLLSTVTLLVGEKLTYTHGSAWQVVSNSGNIKYTVLGTTGVDSLSGGSTGLTPATATTGAITLGGTLAVASGGTGTASPSLVAGTNVTITGTWPNQTVNSSASGTVTSVTGTSPVVSSGGTTPAISMAAATTSVDGYLTSTDWTTFNNKGSGTVTSVSASVPAFLSVAGSPVTTSGTLAISYSGTALPVANGGTGATTAGGALTSLGAIGSVASADGSVTVAQIGTAIDLSVATAASTTNVLCQVRNTTGATLTKGTAVYISGATGQIPTVSKALATSDATSAQTLGLMTADLANNSNGFVTVIGLISNIDTSAYIDGAQLYLSGVTAGTLTATKPYAPIHLVYIAVVEHSHVTQGKLFVKVQNGYELDEIHNVSAQTPSNGQIIIWNGTTSLWEAANITAGTGISVTNAAGSITVANTGVTSVTGTSPITSSGGATPAISLAASYGDTQNPYASKTANYVLAAPNGTAGVPTFRAIVAADIPTLNQNTSGSAGSVTNALTSGTGISFSVGSTYNGSAAITVNNSLPMVYPGSGIPNSTGTAWGTSYSTTGSGTVIALATSPSFVTPVLGTVTSGDFSTGTFTWPTFNQSTSGNSATSTLATTATNIAGGVNLQIPYNTSSGATSFIAAPTIGSTYLQYNGTGFTWAAAAGVGTVTSVAATVPSFLSITGSPITTTGTLAISYSGTALPIANGGTGQTTAGAAFNALSPITTTGDLILGNGTNSATRLGIGANSYVLTSDGTTASWAAATGSSSAYTRTSFTATASQTAFTVSYSVGYLQVYVNGVLLATSDYTATSGTGFTLAVACASGDIVEALVITTSVIANGISTGKSIAMAMIFGF